MQKQILKRRLRLLFFALYLTLFFWYLRTYVFDTSESATLIIAALLVGLAIGFVVSGFRLKQIFLRSFAAGSIRVGTPDEFPQLDVAELERTTREWRALGFEVCRDRAGNMDNPRGGPTFSRSFEHREEGAIAEISQQFLLTQVVPFSTVVISFWGERQPVLDAAAGLARIESAPPLAAPGATPAGQAAPAIADEVAPWTLVTHNRPPTKLWKLMRRSRLVSRRLERGATPEALWRAHLEQRAEVEARLHQPHLHGDLEPLLEAHGAVVSAQLHARLLHTPAYQFGLARFSLAQSPANYESELPEWTARVNRAAHTLAGH